MESYEQCGQGRSYCSLCTLDTMHRLFFVTRLIINKINQVQWVDFKLENVLVSLHSLKTMCLAPFGASAPLFLRNGELLGHSPIQIKRLIRIQGNVSTEAIYLPKDF
jgi:hypothetical protein